MANLITLDEYKEAEGISNPKEDLKISALIPSVSQLVKTYCNSSFVDYYATDKVETISLSYNTEVVQLAESPVVSITTVQERTSYSSAYVTLTTGAHQYFLDTDTDSLSRTTGAGTRYWAKGPGSVVVSYKAGYADVPADLKLAVYDLITYYLKDEYKERKVMAGASVQNATSTSQPNNVAFPDHIKRVLDLYKNF
jgi:hypothetical protein